MTNLGDGLGGVARSSHLLLIGLQVLFRVWRRLEELANGAWLSVNIFLPQGHEEALCHWLVHGAAIRISDDGALNMCEPTALLGLPLLRKMSLPDNRSNHGGDEDKH